VKPLAKAAVEDSLRGYDLGESSVDRQGRSTNLGFVDS